MLVISIVFLAENGKIKAVILWLTTNIKFQIFSKSFPNFFQEILLYLPICSTIHSHTSPSLICIVAKKKVCKNSSLVFFLCFSSRGQP